MVTKSYRAATCEAWTSPKGSGWRPRGCRLERAADPGPRRRRAPFYRWFPDGS